MTAANLLGAVYGFCLENVKDKEDFDARLNPPPKTDPKVQAERRRLLEMMGGEIL